MCIKRYGRYWAVYASDGALICLCVYRKGALEVVKRIQHALDDAQQWQDSMVPLRHARATRCPAGCSNGNPGAASV